MKKQKSPVDLCYKVILTINNFIMKKKYFFAAVIVACLGSIPYIYASSSEPDPTQPPVNPDPVTNTGPAELKENKDTYGSPRYMKFCMCKNANPCTESSY